jgi:chorismate mutase/prephenate dehydratase
MKQPTEPTPSSPPSEPASSEELERISLTDVYDLPDDAADSRAPVAFVGPAGSHGDDALRAWKKAKENSPHVPRLACPDVHSCLRAVADGDAAMGIIPWRNALGGPFHDSYDALLEHGLWIVDSLPVPARHCLAAREPLARHAIRRVVSHPEALRQCRRLLSSLPGAAREPATSTSAAISELLKVAQDGETAVLCRPEAAREAGLEILVDDASDHPDNQDLFVVVVPRQRGQLPENRAGLPWRTTIAMTVADRSGALSKCLAILADAGVQLTHLESRPVTGRPWEVQFTLEAEGHAGAGALGHALVALRPACSHLDLLGSWVDDDGSMQLGASTEAEEIQITADPRELSPPASLLEAQAKQTPLVHLRESEERTIVRVGRVEIGGGGFTMIAGPCSIESAEQVEEIAEAIRAEGGQLLRGGAFKPRTSPYSFQGLGEDGLRILAAAGKRRGLGTVTEVMREEQVELVARHCDMLQIGARNMQNFPLLRAVGESGRPVLLKRGMSSSIDELLCAAEYVLERGNNQVVLCERGIRTFETATRATLDLSAVPVLLERTHLPVIVDPSHAAGVRRYVPALARAARAVGAHGIIVEVHPRPSEALSDGPQALTLPMWRSLARELRGARSRAA